VVIIPKNNLIKFWLQNQYEGRNETESFYILGYLAGSYHKTLAIRNFLKIWAILPRKILCIVRNPIFRSKSYFSHQNATTF